MVRMRVQKVGQEVLTEGKGTSERGNSMSKGPKALNDMFRKRYRAHMCGSQGIGWE